MSKFTNAIQISAPIDVSVPKPTCRMIWYEKFDKNNKWNQINLVVEWPNTPNWFHRLMLSLFFGCKFEILEDGK